jgi:hypothetical protein
MESLPAALFKRLNDIVGSLQKQAPAARMIGKFAVQQATTEVERRLSDLSKFSPPTSEKPEE